MDFKLNFLGINVADFAQSYQFYTEVLGIEARDAKPDWAYFATTTRSRMGHGQTIRPSFQIAHLEQTVSNLRHNGVKFIGAIEQTLWGEHIELIAPAAIRWTLAHAPASPFGTSLRQPHLGWVEVKVHNLAGQQPFESLKDYNYDMYTMQKWFNDVGDQANIAIVRHLHPGLQTLVQWLQHNGWANDHAASSLGREREV